VFKTSQKLIIKKQVFKTSSKRIVKWVRRRRRPPPSSNNLSYKWQFSKQVKNLIIQKDCVQNQPKT